MDMFGFDPPTITEREALAFAEQIWGVTGSVTRFRGERSCNLRIAGHRVGDRTEIDVVLQVHASAQDPAAIDLQTQALLTAQREAPKVTAPRVVPTLDGATLATVEHRGVEHVAGMVSFVPGTTFDPDIRLSDAAYVDIGAVLGQLAKGLADFTHPHAGHVMPWDIGNGLIIEPAIRDGLHPMSAHALSLVDDRLSALAKTLATLPHQTIHNDGHAGNLIRRDDLAEAVVGVIDFGDVVHTATVADVAIAAESFALPHDDAVDITGLIAAGYHRFRPLADREIAVIPEAVLGRLALSILLHEYQVRLGHDADPDDSLRTELIERLRRWQRLDPEQFSERVAATINADRHEGPER